MSLKKFGRNDVILNTMVAYPQCEFFIYDGDIFYNSVPAQSGSRNAQVRNVPSGFVSLYEYNIDRPDDDNASSVAIGEQVSFPLSGAGETVSLAPVLYTTAVSDLEPGEAITFVKDTARIFPWISKDGAGASWKTVSDTAYATEFQYGDILVGTYPLSASITRERIVLPSGSFNKHYYSLKNRLNFYGTRNVHYRVSASVGSQSWNKDTQNLNTIAIPSIFFGSRIKPGTVSLKWFYTGSLVAELQDTRQNGELIQISGSRGFQTYNNETAGVVLYDEGYIILTGSWALNNESVTLDAATENPTWLHYGVGANDNTTGMSNNVSFGLSFKGHTETQVMTLFAHAKRNQANFSNNPTYIQYGQDHIQFTSSHVYEENSELLIANTVSSSYSNYKADFKRSVYISRILVYDENHNIIGVATLANPVLKEEDQDYSFKLKLDI
jgi:hypothetical protein